jgi:hypothetical protein
MRHRSHDAPGCDKSEPRSRFRRAPRRHRAYGTETLVRRKPSAAVATKRRSPKLPAPANDVELAPSRSAKAAVHAWAFRARFRRDAFGWKSQPAITRVREAVAEIKKAAKREPLVAAEGAVLFLERVSPALSHVDGSSGAIGSAVNHAIEGLVALLAAAPADTATREAWLERLYEAHQNDEIPYIESLADHWGELCVTKELASQWGDRLLGITRNALSQDKNLRGHYHGTTMCLTALYRAERYTELIDLLEHEKFWHYKRWAVKALAAIGKKAEALALAEASRGPWTSETDVARRSEEILLSSGLVDEAFADHAAIANRGGTYLATFRASRRSTRRSPKGTCWRSSLRRRRATRASGSRRRRTPGSSTRRSRWHGGLRPIREPWRGRRAIMSTRSRRSRWRPASWRSTGWRWATGMR